MTVTITSAQQLSKLAGRLEAHLKRDSTEVGNTRERPMSGEFIFLIDSLQGLIDNLTPMIPEEVLSREADEYGELLNVATDVCRREFTRDIHGRRAVALSAGCVTYQHFTIRRGSLLYSVHMRGMDTRKFLADFQLFLTVMRYVTKFSVPAEAKPLKQVEFKLHVDCFHSYLEPAKVPL